MKIEQIFVESYINNPSIDQSYFYIVYNENSRQAIAFDPGWDKPIDDFLQKNNLNLIAILNTHHHSDHVGANLSLQKKYNCPIYASEYDKLRVPGVTNLLLANQCVSLMGLSIRALDLKAHTLGLVGYYMESLAALFPGDALFSVGCGRLFEGTAQDLLKSFAMIASLPPDTQIYCSHEYTLKNIEFAKTIDGDNSKLLSYEVEANQRRQEGLPTIPCRLEDELAINPYFRASAPHFMQKHGFSDPAQLIGHLRKLKDRF